MDGTIIGQGIITAKYTGANPLPGSVTVQAASQQIIPIPSGADWVSVRNYTQSGTASSTAIYFQGTANASAGVEFFWQLGMPMGSAIVKYYTTSGAVRGDTIVGGGFTFYDPSGQLSGAQPVLSISEATTATTNTTTPVVSTATTTGLSVGSIVRLSGTGQTDINGADFVVGAVTSGTSFQLLTSTNPLANVPGAVGGAGFYRIINFDPLYYPRRRFVVNIAKTPNAQVSTSVPHQYVVGQAIRFNIPAVSGMVQLNPTNANNYLTVTVTGVVDAYNFTINVDTTNYTTFAWPTVTQQPSSFPEVTPVGENTAVALASTAPQTPIDLYGNQILNTNVGILSDSTVNTGFYGMILGSGGNGTLLTTPIVGPAGTVSFNTANAITAADKLFWIAGKSSYGGQ